MTGQALPERCRCGSNNVGVETARVAEDAVETWVECADCGKRGEVTEDAYANPCGAVHLWNAAAETEEAELSDGAE